MLDFWTLITCVKFYINRFRDFDSERVEIRYSPVTKPVTVSVYSAALPRFL